MGTSSEFFIKARKIGTRAWLFVEPRGGMTNLRVHAARYTEEKVGNTMRSMQEMNKSYEFKAVPA